MLESLITFSRDSASQQQVAILLASSCYDVHIIHWGFAHQQPLGFLITLTRSTHSRHCLLQLHNILFFRRHRMYLCDALYFANVFSLIGVCPIKGTPDSAITESNGAWRVFNFVHSGLNGILIVQLWSEFDKRIVVNSYIGDSLNIGRLVLISWERSTHSFHACFIGRCMLVSDSTQQPSSPLVSYAHCKLRTPCDGAYSSIRGLFIDGRSNNLA